MDFKDLKIEDVHSVYSGRPGCMCGCKGNHWHAEGQATNDYDRENPRQVARVFNFFKKNPALVEFNDDYRTFFWITTETREFVVYLED